MNRSFCVQLTDNIHRQRALTLVELAVVLTIIMALVSIFLVGVTAYKRGADRATCVQNIVNVQKAMRSYCHLNDALPGQAISDLKDEIVGAGKFLTNVPHCPANGRYHFYGDGTDPTESSAIPDRGVNYLRCNITQHTPSSMIGW